MKTIWGEIIDRPSADLIELRWFDSTEGMSADEFKQALTAFADHVERVRRREALIDGTSFLMSPANMDEQWRDANIVPRYKRGRLEQVRLPYAFRYARYWF